MHEPAPGALAQHWRSLAERWQLQESPGRPCAEDVAFYEEALAGWHAQQRAVSPRALLLGVTPEIALMRWPRGTRVLAVDQSRTMIGAVWPGAALGFSAACARWTALPLPAGSRDIAIGDGCFSSLRGAEYGALARSVRRVLRPGGLFVVRCFTRPAAPEPVERVFDDLFHGRIGSFFAFKWRLAMALHGTLAEGVPLGRIWEAWHAAVPDPARLAHERGWQVEKVRMMDIYRDSGLSFTFPTLAEARAALRPEFEELACRVPGYELGDRCPTLVLRPGQAGGPP